MSSKFLLQPQRNCHTKSFCCNLPLAVLDLAKGHIHRPNRQPKTPYRKRLRRELAGPFRRRSGVTTQRMNPWDCRESCAGPRTPFPNCEKMIIRFALQPWQSKEAGSVLDRARRRDSALGAMSRRKLLSLLGGSLASYCFLPTRGTGAANTAAAQIKFALKACPSAWKPTKLPGFPRASGPWLAA